MVPAEVLSVGADRRAGGPIAAALPTSWFAAQGIYQFVPTSTRAGWDEKLGSISAIRARSAGSHSTKRTTPNPISGWLILAE